MDNTNFVLSVGLYGYLFFGNMGKINKGEVTQSGENKDMASKCIHHVMQSQPSCVCSALLSLDMVVLGAFAVVC